jgi:hypothetical protein
METTFSNPQQYGNWQTYAGFNNPDTGTYTFGQKPSASKPKASGNMGSPIAPPNVMPKTDYSVVPVNTTQFGIPFDSLTQLSSDPAAAMSPQNASLLEAFTASGGY